jgi:dolichyl-phosphate beta-glucosyltransferase
MSESQYLSVVIPAYNESHRIEATLSAVQHYLEGRAYSYEVIVVDDGSHDDTVARVQALAAHWPALRVVRLPSNQGKGAAVRTGCLEAKGERVLFMDADHSTRIEQIEDFLPHLEGRFEVVAGVRAFQEGESRARRIVGLGFLMLAHLIVFQKAVVDSQCGFKCFTREAVQAIFSRTHVNGGTIDVEIFYYAHRLGLPIYFQPVEWCNAPGSTISPFRCLVQDPIDMIRIRLRDVFDRD